MKASELMIGDWVDIQEEGKHLKYTKVHDLSASRDEDYYFPIPLTEEILKANGFVFNKGGWWLRSDLFTLNRFVEGGYCASAFREQVFINNVHELQHALRLCGLNELADNLKME